MKIVIFTSDSILLNKISFAVRCLVTVEARSQASIERATPVDNRRERWVIDTRERWDAPAEVAGKVASTLGRHRFIVMSANPTIEDRMSCIRAGAFDCLPANISHREIRTVLAPLVAGCDTTSRSDGEDCQFDLEQFIVGNSSHVRTVRSQIRRIAKTGCTVVITGESGSGKELVANALHRLSSRRNGPFVTVNCAAVPSSIFESEFFGVIRGAYTDAVDRPGLFRQADRGTLFLDEVGELPQENQAKLLRILESREVTPLGSQGSVAVDVRVVCATNRSLKELVRQGRFRHDLYYRLNTAPIRLSPLRDHPEDIEPLVEATLQDLACCDRKLTRQAVERLKTYSWPGNVRELRHVLERTVLFCDEIEIGPELLQFDPV